ncbi:hypothetical protein AK88_05073 [Plasmodium fragile]|uniref:Protein LTV1 homolog n=1 Tax=Plasmodium fragile TaxID=5857 RepID=A0A0D9QHV2_PLAFR|nr:uncharacterized protein AK88_05073 [Plasmodium fragile]KJP85291.1 hypothetical protein AK88_05073 [Plasmodium fragile]
MKKGGSGGGPGQNGGAGRSGGGCQIKKVTFREPPVVCEFSENEKHEFDEESCEEDEANDFFLDDTELSSLMENLDPTDFGIKEKLTESEKKILIREIYGRLGSNSSYSTSSQNERKGKKKDKKNVITLRLENSLEEQPKGTQEHTKSYASKQNGESELWEHDLDNTSETNHKTMDEQKKKKKKKKKIKGRRKEEEEDPMAYLDGDCYFPDDGYDYEQHLKSISANFVSAKSKAENNFFEVKPTDEEERELFKTFEEDNYEELNDNFVYEAQDVNGEDKLDVPKDLIWGTPDWSFPMGGANVTYLTADPMQLNEMSDSQNGDKTDAEVSDVEADRSAANHHPRSGSVSSDSGDEGSNPEENGYVIFDESTHQKVSTYQKQKQKDTDAKNGDPNALKLSDLVKREMQKVENKNLNEIKNILDKIKILQMLNSQKEEEGHRGGEGAEKENSRSDASGEFSFSSSDASSSSLSYDCETILTTKTNTTNHPCKLVIPKKVSTPASASLLINPLPHGSANPKRKDKEKEKVSEEAKLESYLVLENVSSSPDGINTTRGKNETPEEKRERKRSVKEAQRLNRKMKKENALLMKSEKKMMNKKSNPFDIRDNVKYIKL